MHRASHVSAEADNCIRHWTGRWELTSTMSESSSEIWPEVFSIVVELFKTSPEDLCKISEHDFSYTHSARQIICMA